MLVKCRSCGAEENFDGRVVKNRLPILTCPRCGTKGLIRADTQATVEEPPNVEEAKPTIIQTLVLVSPSERSCRRCRQPLHKWKNFNDACHLFRCLNEDCLLCRRPQGIELIPKEGEVAAGALGNEKETPK
jgi:hypothetical protein